jgi:GDPmannose 4,6-dehydratase
MGTLRLLEAIRILKLDCKFYQAGSSEMYGGLYGGNTVLDEDCKFHPRSPYGCAKVFAHNITVNYRESYGMFACNGILFNHESPRRGVTFVTRKITRFVADVQSILHRRNDKLYLGNLEAKRDWGYAPEYVVAMWKMLQANKPTDYVIATGEAHSVTEFVEEAFAHAGLECADFVRFDERYVRPAEVDVLVGWPLKAELLLDWTPKVTFTELVKLMVEADLTGREKGLEEVWASA